MSESYQELDLDNLPKAPGLPLPNDIEIVDDDTPEPTPAPAPKPAPVAAEPDDDDEEVGTPGEERKRLTRSQRLKLQRDALAAKLAAAEAKANELTERVKKFETETAEATESGFEFYLQTLTDKQKALRAEFNAAFDAGDRDKVFEVQQKLAELAADRKAVERDRAAARPTKGAPSGTAAPPATPQTTSEAKITNPLVADWYGRNKEWFNRDPVMTAVARTIDQQLLADGFDPSEPEFFEEIDKRLREELPHKFGGAQPTARKPAPTILNKSASPSPTGKRTVRITSADREMADRLGLPIEVYAREKLKKEMADASASGYVEVV